MFVTYFKSTKMDYKNTFDFIAAWAGTATQYWQAVEFLKGLKQLTDSEIANVDEGLDAFTGAIIDDKMANLKAITLGQGLEVVSVSQDNTSPDISAGTAVYQLPENTGANEIYILDNAVIGERITLEWLSTTNHSVITNGTTFALDGNFTPANGAKLVLEVITNNTFQEMYREI